MRSDRYHGARSSTRNAPAVHRHFTLPMPIGGRRGQITIKTRGSRGHVADDGVAHPIACQAHARGWRSNPVWEGHCTRNIQECPGPSMPGGITPGMAGIGYVRGWSDGALQGSRGPRPGEPTSVRPPRTGTPRTHGIKQRTVGSWFWKFRRAFSRLHVP